jgi:hypothetical protein
MRHVARVALIAAAIAVGGASAKMGEVAGEILAYRAIRGTVVILDEKRRVVATVASNSAGAFHAALPPGRYSLTLQESSKPHMGKGRRPVEVVVEAGKTVHARVVFDTGLR